MTASLLGQWANFYVITGSAAAALIGLTFVVIALAADAQRANALGLRAFVTPTIVHFSAVLALAAFMSVPGQRTVGLAVGCGAAGVAGLFYASTVVASMRRLASDYVAGREDWLWNALLPAIAYGVLLVMALLLGRRPQQSLYGIAAASVLLLFIGIHNAWDVAVWNSVKKPRA